VDAVVALNPAPAHLPALSPLLVGNGDKFRSLLEKVQQGRFKSKRRRLANQFPQCIRASYPGLWQQL
jgi:hypothetical protein